MGFFKDTTLYFFVMHAVVVGYQKKNQMTGSLSPSFSLLLFLPLLSLSNMRIFSEEAITFDFSPKWLSDKRASKKKIFLRHQIASHENN